MSQSLVGLDSRTSRTAPPTMYASKLALINVSTIFTARGSIASFMHSLYTPPMTVVVEQTLDENLTSEEIFAQILKSKGLDSKDKIEAFLSPNHPTLNHLLQAIPVNKRSLARAKKIVAQKVKEGKDILVYGDYDADGLTSTAIMWMTLMGLAKGSSARVFPFIPDRHRHGYGLSDRALQDIFDGTVFKETNYQDFHPELIITVDNGIVAVKQVAELKNKGVSVILTDHHQPGDVIPDADAIIHSTVTSGVGISYLASLYFSKGRVAVTKMLGIAAIGIVADQIPLVGINRDLIVHGLKDLENNYFPGITALKKAAGVDNRTINTYDINFALAPRLNAVGRLDNPMDGLRLLCTRDPKQAKILAATVELLNKKRQELTDQAVADALQEKVEHKLIIVASRMYHEGIIGLVAGKLVEKYHRPAIVVALGDKVSKGSARSLPGINITNLLRQHSSLFLSLGGHEQAAGFSIATSDLNQLKTIFFQLADQQIDESLLVYHPRADFGITLKQCTLVLAQAISRLEPFGIGNFKPRFYFENLYVLEHRTMGGGGKHLKLVVEQNGVTREAIKFNHQGNIPKLIKGMIASLDINHWKNRNYLQLMIDYVEG